ncbi:hypothetical protein [Gulosibacter chungangensis]|uniref:Uncharacterized protein n=1 Tax=Gulosibacter chungangensis TaxID=979746 RepID=A0A7J5BAM6_9MICO|nr:hypothetical protein [Gulosibacter chungangensis]KAB1643105.1 hypothetical protein F8O05_07615 [Gulosibacter chungangensis]
MTETGNIPSWDAQREAAPERPSIPTGLIKEQRIDRPQRVMVAYYLALFGTLCFLGVLLIAILHIDQIRESFIAVLNDNLEEDYAQEDKEKAVYIMLGIMGILALMVTLGLLMAATSVKASKNSAGRIIMFILLALFIPAAFLVASLREENALELVLGALAALAFLAAAVLYQGTAVTTWLRQSDKAPATPITAFHDTSGRPIEELTKLRTGRAESKEAVSEEAQADQIDLENLKVPEDGFEDTTREA